MTKEEREAMHRRIEANRDLDTSRCEVRKEQLARRSARNAVKMQITRMAKSGLLESTKFRRQQALEDKFRRFEWRTHREEVLEIQKRWITAAVYASLLTISHTALTARKLLHARSREHLNFLALLSLSVGKLMRLVKKDRLRRAMQVSSMQRIARAVPRIRRWMRVRKEKYRVLITALAEKATTQNIVFQLMTLWLWRLRKVQKAIKSFLLTRRLFYVQSKMSWALAEISLYKATAKVRTFSTELLEGKAPIPDKIKEYYLRICIQKKLIRYFFEVRNHKRKCKELQSDHESRLLVQEAERVMKGEPTTHMETLVLPPLPALILQLSKDEFKALILEAEKSRLNWDKIQQHVEQPFDRRRPTKATVVSYNDRRKSKAEFRARSPTVN